MGFLIFIFYCLNQQRVFADSTLSQETPSIVESLEPVIIEAPQLEETPAQVQTIQVPGGNGMKPIDPSLNSLGIEIRNSQNLEDLSIGRRNDGWWLVLNPRHEGWQTQAKADLSSDQKIKVRSTGDVLGTKTKVEGGFAQDHRSISYFSNSGNPYLDTATQSNSYQNHTDSGYASLLIEKEAWKALSEFDGKSQDVRAGPSLIGRKYQLQGGLSGNWKTEVFAFKPYFQAQNERFNSQLGSLYSTSSSTQSFRGGIQNEFQLGSFFTLQTFLSKENLGRTSADRGGISASFERYNEKISGNLNWMTGKWIEIQSHGILDFVQDQASLQGVSQSVWIWDTGLELSTSHRYSFGLVTRIRRFALIPTPTQRFGDGGLLQPAVDLPPEEGIRFAIGPWYEKGPISVEASVFAEETTHSPIMEAPTPTTARTTAIGGVWARGLELKAKAQVSYFTFRHSLSFQDAVNASQLNWQRGQPIPGRPQWTAKAEALFEKKRIKSGMSYLFKSPDAQTLSGQWFRPSQNQVDLFTGYGKKDWEVRLVVQNLFPNSSLSTLSGFQGSAAPNLLEPDIPQTQLRVQCEVLI